MQEVKELVTAIKFLVEEGSYKYILSGSMLGVELQDIKSQPVGYLDEILTRLCIHSGERITTGKNKIAAEKFLYDLKKKHFDILNYSQKQKIKYIYKYNIWQRYKSSHSYKQYLWLLYIIISHPLIVFRKAIKNG